MARDDQPQYDLETELRARRPEPRPDLVQQLAARIEAAPAERRPGRRTAGERRLRPALAFVFLVVVLAALSAFGGVGYAKHSVVNAVKSSSHAVQSVVLGRNVSSSRRGDDDDERGGNNGNNGNNGNGGSNGGGGGGRGDDDDEKCSFGGDRNRIAGVRCVDDPPFFHQYSRFVLVCYPFQVRRGQVRFRTIVVPRQFVSFFVPPGTLGPCGFRPRGRGGDDD